MKKIVGRSSVLIFGIIFGLSAGYFLVEGVKGISANTVALVQGVELFEEKEEVEIKEREDKVDIFDFFEKTKVYKISNKAPVPYLTADSYLVGDIETGEIILSGNQNKPMPMASISKLMTAVVAEEKIGKDTEIRVSREAVSTYGKQGGLSTGDEYKIEDILYPLLLESSNDAAEAIAEAFIRNSFMAELNNKAKELEMYNTHFSDPSGLSPNNISSVSDLFKLTQYLERDKDFVLEISRTKKYELGRKVWFNNSKFRSDDDYYGGKNGYTDIAWKTQVAIFKIDFDGETRKIAFIILKTDDIEGDIYGLKRYVERHVSWE